MDLIEYRVRAGDTLSAIALRYGTTVQVLVRINGVRDPNRILLGQRLKIPRASASTHTAPLVCPFSPGKATIDSAVAEYQQAAPLYLPEISSEKEPWTYEGLIDAYARLHGAADSARLLFLLSKEGGGAGYEIHKKKMYIDAWDVDHEQKIIFIDEDEIFSGRTNREAAMALHRAIGQEFEGKESFWQATWRVVSGAGITALGVVEVGVGVIGIIIPEPGTTIAGVGLVAFGGSQVVEGVTRIANVNKGKGYNPLEELIFVPIGKSLGGGDGESLARVAFAVTNLVVSLGGSYKVLSVPGRPLVHAGTYSGSKMNFYKEGFTVGRLQLWYPMTLGAEANSTGHVLINVVNNSNQWIFRFQQIKTTSAALKAQKTVVMNGRIIDMQKWHRVNDPKEMLKILLKLAGHGFKRGL
ncbi:LysM peptidoglycan-binding domain-containing protein [Cystobacter fuscus]